MDPIVNEVIECLDNVLKYMRLHDKINNDDIQQQYIQNDIDITLSYSKQACSVFIDEIDLQNIIDDTYISIMHRRILKEPIVYSMIENKFDKVLQLLINLFGNNHDIIAEYYLYYSDIEMNNENYDDALNHAGEGLSHRIKYLGLLHKKTADSHFKLGLIYMKLNDLDQAKKQFLIVRQVRCISDQGDNSLQIADCDIQLGFIVSMSNIKVSESESGSKSPSKSSIPKGLAYSYFYSCFRRRNAILGFNHSSTQKAYEYVLSSRHANGRRYISSLELKDSTEKLNWIAEESSTIQYRVAVCIDQLANEEILDLYQLKSLVAVAIQYSFLTEEEGDNIANDSSEAAVEDIVKYLLLTAEQSYSHDFRPDIEAISTALNQLNPHIIESRKSSLKQKGVESPPKSVQFKMKTPSSHNIIPTKKIENDVNTKPIQHAEPKIHTNTTIQSNTKNNTLMSPRPSKNINELIPTNRNTNNDLMNKQFPWLEANNMKDVYLPVALGARTSMIAQDLDGKRLLVTLASNEDIIKHNPAKLNAIGVFNLLLKKKRSPDRIPNPPPLPTTWPPVPYHPNNVAEVLSPQKTAEMYKKINLDCYSDIDGTIWSEQLDSLYTEDALFSDLVEEFNNGIIQKRRKSIRAKSTLKAKPTYLENVREQNISIMLTKFGKRHVTDICNAVLEFNTDFIGINSLTLMTKYLPDAQDIKAIEAHMKEEPFFGVPPKLSKAEEYLLGMSKISNPLDRILSMGSCLNYSTVSAEISKNSTLIIDAVREIQESARLKYLLKAFLDLHNAVNRLSSDLDEAKGFRITTSLSKLHEMKTNSGETIEYYVTKSLYSVSPEALDLRRDFPTLDIAKSISFQKITFDLKRFEEDLHRLENVRKVEKNSVALDRINLFSDKMQADYNIVSLRFQQAQNEFKDLCFYLGEDKTEPDVLLPCLNHLINCVEACKANVIKAKEVASRKESTSIKRLFDVSKKSEKLSSL